jgi:hypothetical protein
MVAALPDPEMPLSLFDRGCSDARHVRAVPVVVLIVAQPRSKVPAVDVVGEAVALVVDAIAGNLAGVCPDSRLVDPRESVYTPVSSMPNDDLRLSLREFPRRLLRLDAVKVCDGTG